MNLQEELDKVKADMGPKIPDEVKELLGKSQAEIAATGLIDLAPKTGDRYIDFTLPDGNGKMVKLSDLLAKGPVFLNFVRGKW